jgi:hypothetical protein
MRKRESRLQSRRREAGGLGGKITRMCTAFGFHGEVKNILLKHSGATSQDLNTILPGPLHECVHDQNIVIKD